MNELNIDENYLDVIKPALEKSSKEGVPVMAISVNGKIITGKQTKLLTPPSSAILNAIKYLSKIPDDIDLLSPNVLEPVLKLKKSTITGSRLRLSEVLTALSICSVTNPMIEKALTELKKLRGCDAHATYLITGSDKRTLKTLQINLTCESEYIEKEDY